MPPALEAGGQRMVGAAAPLIASPNVVHFVYDADESSFEASVPVPEGTAALEDLFEILFTRKGVPYEDTEFSGRSDYQAFINNGTPSSGLFTGAEVLKTPGAGGHLGRCGGRAVRPVLPPRQRLPREPGLTALGLNTDAMAFAVLTRAYSTEATRAAPIGAALVTMAREASCRAVVR